MPTAGFSFSIGFGKGSLESILKILDNLKSATEITEEKLTNIIESILPKIRSLISTNYDTRRGMLGASTEYVERKTALFNRGGRVFVSDSLGRHTVVHPRARCLRTEQLFKSIKRKSGRNVGIVFETQEKENGGTARIFFNEDIFRKKRGRSYARAINDQINFMGLDNSQIEDLANDIIDLINEEISKGFE